MGRRRDSHRRHRELSFDEETDLLGWGDRVFESDEAHRSAWWVHRAALLGHLGGRLPGTRPKAYWDYEPGARDERDFIGEGIDSDALWEAQIRFLAERGELHADELEALADDVPAKATWTEEAQERARRRLEAALEGLAANERNDTDRGGR